VTESKRLHAKCHACGKPFTIWHELWDLIHQVWGDAKAAPLYRKYLWHRLQLILVTWQRHFQWW
jgi:hypothetical protein